MGARGIVIWKGRKVEKLKGRAPCARLADDSILYLSVSAVLLLFGFTSLREFMNAKNHQKTWPRLNPDDQVACHFCDALHHAPDLEEGDSAMCSNCGFVLFRNRRNSLTRVVSYSIAALIFTVLVHTFPILVMEVVGNRTKLTLIEAIRELMVLHEYLLAMLIAVFTVLSPLLLMGGLLYIVAPLMVGRTLPHAKRLVVWVQLAEPWAMLEVFLLGFIVSLLKLGHIAELHFEIGLWALIALVVCMSAAIAAVDRRELWDRLELLEFEQKTAKENQVDDCVVDSKLEGECQS